jgi:hypothetical protein
MLPPDRPQPSFTVDLGELSLFQRVGARNELQNFVTGRRQAAD